jgi:hypothetical protein
MSLVSSRREINFVVRAELSRAMRDGAAKTADEKDHLRKKCAELKGHASIFRLVEPNHAGAAQPVRGTPIALHHRHGLRQPA